MDVAEIIITLVVGILIGVIGRGLWEGNRKFYEQNHFIIHKLNSIMATLAEIQAQNTALIAAVADEDTVIGSAITLIDGFGTTLQSLKDQLATAIANGLDPAAAQTVVDSIGATITDINAKKQQLADAVTANTPTP